MRAYAVCIGVTPECRQMESEMIRDGRGHADEAYHDTLSNLSDLSSLVITGNSLVS